MFELQKERAELLEKIEELFSRKRYPELREVFLAIEAQKYVDTRLHGQ